MNNWHKNWIVFGVNTVVSVLISFLKQLGQ